MESRASLSPKFTVNFSLQNQRNAAKLPWMGSRLAGVVGIVCLAQVASADPGPPPSGRWSAGVLQSVWSLDNWGNECGPSPVGSSEAGGLVTLAHASNEITITGLGRSFSSSSCWDPQPNVAVASHTAGPGRWSTVCRSAPGDPRRVTITTGLALNGSALELNESGTYEVAIAGRQCSATVHRFRRYTLIQADNAVPESNLNDTAIKPTGAACATPGAVARIEASPMYKLLKRGEQFSLKARLLDEKGCPVAQRVVWKLPIPRAGVQVDAFGKISAGVDAAEGEVRISASYGEQSTQVLVYIVSEARYAELLASPSFNKLGESEAKSVKAFAPTALGASAAKVDPTARHRRTLFIWAVTALASVLGIAAVFLARRRPRVVEDLMPARPSEPSKPAPAYSGGAPERSRTPVRRICPICGAQYDEEAKTCIKEGAVLVPLN